MNEPHIEYGRFFTPLFGRKDELALFNEILGHTQAGGLHGLLISGEPGIGKSRLLYEFSRSAADKNIPIAFYRFREGDNYSSQVVWKHLLQSLNGEVLAAAAIPNTLDIFFSRIKSITADTTVSIFLDNIHLAPSPFLHELIQIMDELFGNAVTIVMAYQDLPVYKSPAFMEILSESTKLPSIGEYKLMHIDEHLSKEMLYHITGRDLTIGFAGSLVKQSSGNPLFIQEIARLIRILGTKTEAELSALWECEIPQRIYTVISERVRHLSPWCLSLLRKLSLLPNPITRGQITQSTGEETLEHIDSCIEEAISHGFIALAGGIKRYCFTHSLIKEAIRNSIPSAERKELSRSLTRYIEMSGLAKKSKWAETLSYLWLDVYDNPWGREKSLHYAMAAAEAVFVTQDYEYALRVLDRVVDLSTDEPESKQEADILYMAGQIKNYSADTVQALAYIKRAVRYYLEHCDRDKILSLSLHPALLPISTPDFSDLYEEILAYSQFEGDYRAMILMHYSGTLINNCGNYSEAEIKLGMAKEISRHSEDPRLKMVMLIVESYLDYHYGRLWPALSKLEKAGELQEKIGDLYSLPNIYFGKCAVYTALGKHWKAAQLLEPMIARTEEIPLASNLFMSYVVAARQKMLDAEWELAIAHLDRGMRRYPENSFLLTHRIHIAYLLGNFETGDHMKRYLNSLQSRMHQGFSLLNQHICAVEVIRALCTADLSNIKHTVSALRRSISQARQHPFVAIRAYLLLCLAASLLHDLDLIDFSIAGLHQYRDYYLIRPYFIDRARALAEHTRGNHKRAMKHIERAAEAAGFFQDKPMNAVLLYERACIEMDHDCEDLHPQRITELLTTCRVEAAEMGMKPLIQQAERLLSEITDVRKSGDTIHFHLTRREIEILQLIGRGMSNSAIAENLHISIHTVSNHIRNILKKTKTRNRVAAYSLASTKQLLKK